MKDINIKYKSKDKDNDNDNDNENISSEYAEYKNILEKQNVSENTFLDYENLDQIELVCRYIMEVKNKGHFLPYEEYDIVKKWLKSAGKKAEM